MPTLKPKPKKPRDANGFQWKSKTRDNVGLSRSRMNLKKRIIAAAGATDQTVAQWVGTLLATITTGVQKP